MNKRQKKKLFKQTLIKVRKLHPQKGDVICFQFDPNEIYGDTVCEMLKFYSDNKVFGNATLACVPLNLKYFGKEAVQFHIDKLQSIVDQIGE